MIHPTDRLAILLHGGIQGIRGKTGLALLRYSQVPIVAVIDRETAGGNLPTLTGIPLSVPIVASVTEALAYAPTVLAIGIAPSGGSLPKDWLVELGQVLDAGVSIANGLHTHLRNLPDFQGNLQPGQWIWDMRQEPPGLTIASAKAQQLTCPRVLAVGTDMAIGKMSTCLELHRAALQAGLRSRFVGTGQAGLMIGGEGVALDAVRVDFAAGAVEQAVLRCSEGAEVLWVEGQGSLLHPGSTATLPLLRGAQPTHLILVHRAGQTHIRDLPQVPIPPLADVVALYETIAHGQGAFPKASVAAIALNTAHLDQDAALHAIETVQAETGLVCTDPVRFGAATLLGAIV